MSQTATVHYLDFEDGEDVRRQVMFDDYEPTQEEFEALYECVGSVSGDFDSVEDALVAAWKQWNRGSGHESDEFLTVECDVCGAEFIDRKSNHKELEAHRSSHRGDVDDVKNIFSGNRSMMAGDIAVYDGSVYMCEPVGWSEIEGIEWGGE